MDEGSQVLVDSDFWLGLYLPNDANSKSAKQLYDLLKRRKVLLSITNLIIGEVATIISHRIGQKHARAFIQSVYKSKLNIIHVTEQINEHAIEIFMHQKGRGTSYVDCTNVAVMKDYKIPYICAFDKIYHKAFKIENIAYPNQKKAA